MSLSEFIERLGVTYTALLALALGAVVGGLILAGSRVAGKGRRDSERDW